MTKTSDNRLSSIPQGNLVKLSALNVGRELASRMTSLGLTPGATLQVIQNHGRGPIIINIRGTHVALGRGEAEQLIVTPSEVE
jgi:ferrous iron transport protein A